MLSLRKVIGLLVLLIAFTVASATDVLAQQQKRLAFVIGNAAYPSDALVTSANDAGLIAQTLQAAGFDVVGARDVDQESLRGALRDFLAKVSAAGPDATVFVYLAGRGVQFEGENYFLPVDAQIANPADVPLQAMRLSDITKSLAGLPTKVNIVVLDAARPNALPKMSQPLASGLALVDPEPNMLIAFNAAPGTVAPEGEGPYGAYAQALAEMMRDGGLSLDEVFDRTRLRVNEVTQGAEIPWDVSKIDVPFVFFERAPDAPPPKVSEAEERTNRTRAIRDFNAHDAYLAALDRDTMRGYEDFIVAYPHDPMAKRVRAIIAARREAITWRETWLRDTPEAYWSYLERYPHGPHAWDARRRLEHFDAELEPPASFTVIVYDVPPPPEEEIVYVDRPVLYFDDPDFDFEPPPPVDVIFLPPPPPDFVVLPPPPPPVDVYVLPTPVFVPVPVWVRPPRDIVPPPDNIIFNNIHNTTVINNINNTTIRNETANQAGQPDGNAEGGLTTGQKMTGAAIGAGATLAARIALPPLLKKRAAVSGQAQFNQNQGALPLKPGQGVTQGQQPGAARPLSKNLSTRKLGTDHALPGADGKTLPLVNGKPVLNGRNLLNDRSRKLLGKQGIVEGNQEATGNAGAAATGVQGTDQRKGKKFRKLPTVNGLPADNGLNSREKLRKNNPNALSDQGNGKPKRLMRKDLSAGRSIVEPGDQGSANRNDKGRKFGKLPTVNGEPADNRPSVRKHLRRNNPDGFSDQGSIDRNVKKVRRPPTVNGEPADNGPSMQKRLRKNNPDVFSGENQGSAGGNDRARKFRRPQNEEGSVGPEVNVQRNFKVNRPNENVQRQLKLQENPNAQARRLPQQPKEQPPQGNNKKFACGKPGEPPCKQ
ncbi:MAG: peptidase C14 caspase catalytic subunit p20 [Mesorhizobium sp.]|uniref:caspase family protein n=4 Tax=Mesorhizobium TaxID=68287 RepID=UPI000F763CCE|nr:MULTISPECIES: caspase domain-containing protein [unclassified Mesorhizobium]AZO33662.1 peptidase C14 caspase catalytic subunit p20 [Mesorhizobium sp. M2A.F.Ca.ET.046.03.2.1]RWB38684.1 MAG: peptidase C14 caspase catalytic subunit p20 [Mesorhizobium sp.]RWF22894.1 MAG: peptidase C14 caspase catalytic subunit p20 [Mesorhizobium sp.]TIV19227.1 MAG: peptidase C14 caspase catalytic subunit p20 [Mesorhizobium sp.]